MKTKQKGNIIKKNLKKLLLLLMLMLFCLPVALSLVGCKQPNNNDPNDPPTPEKVTARQVINESIEKMEDLVFADTEGNGVQVTTRNASISQLLAYSAPNRIDNLENKVQNIISGTNLTIYFSDYIINYLDNIEVNKVYVDSIEQVDMKVYILMEEKDNGIDISLMADMNGNSNVIKTHFVYDYDTNKPLELVVVSSGTSVTVTKYDLVTGIAYDYTVLPASSSVSDMETLLDSKTLDFDAFKDLTVDNYSFTKLEVENLSLKSYSYINDSQDIVEATENDVRDLYNEVYSAVKEYAVPVEELGTTGAVEKVYYQSMFTYASNKSKVYLVNNTIYDMFIDYSDAKSIINQIKTELDKDQYAQYTELRELVAKACTYMQSIDEIDYIGFVEKDSSLSFYPRGIQNGNEYKYELTTMIASVNIVVSGGTLLSILVS